MARMRPAEAKPRLEAIRDDEAGTITLVPEDRNSVATEWITSDSTIDVREAR